MTREEAASELVTIQSDLIDNVGRLQSLATAIEHTNDGVSLLRNYVVPHLQYLIHDAGEYSYGDRPHVAKCLSSGFLSAGP